MKKSKLLLSLGGLFSCVLFGQGFAVPQENVQVPFELDVANPLLDVNASHAFGPGKEDLYINGANVKNTVTWATLEPDAWHLSFIYNGLKYSTQADYTNCTMNSKDKKDGVKIVVDNLDPDPFPPHYFVHIIMPSRTCNMTMD